mmetsp:Transcript_23045/g.33010  ORF Transcript_23045/g.33010 Transcript_23045/m.33010 type:complete len:180 (+) Transcript_23045:306-845(+)
MQAESASIHVLDRSTPAWLVLCNLAMANFEVYRSSQNQREKIGPKYSRHVIANVDANSRVISACFVSVPFLSNGRPSTNCCAVSDSHIRTICNESSVALLEDFRMASGRGDKPLSRIVWATKQLNIYDSSVRVIKMKHVRNLCYRSDCLPAYCNTSSHCTIVYPYGHGLHSNKRIPKLL